MLRSKVQNKEAEINFFDSFTSCNSVANSVYTKVANDCHLLLNCKFGEILEVGCGEGWFGKKLAELGHNVTGIDLSKRLVKNANIDKCSNYIAKVGDIEDNDLFPPNSFSLILSPGVLHHIPSLSESSVIENFSKWLKPGGFVVLWEPNGSNPFNKISKILFQFYSVFFKNNLYSTTNETNHTYWEYKYHYIDKGFKLISSETLSNKATVIPDSFLMRFLIQVRWFAILLTDILFPFPWCGAMLLLSFRKND